MANPHNIQPGQTVWYVSPFKPNGVLESAVVAKVGRIYAVCDGHVRFDLQSLRLSLPHSGPKAVYLSREHFGEEMRRIQLIYRFETDAARILRNNPKPLSDLEQIMKLLGIDVSDIPSAEELAQKFPA